jgi:hypothetical protein
VTNGAIILTVGWVGRHTPPGAGVDGRDAAVIDIATGHLRGTEQKPARPAPSAGRSSECIPD